MPNPPTGQLPQKDVISSFKYPWPFPQQPSLLYRIQANAITFGVFCMAKLILRSSRLKIDPDERRKLVQFVEDRSRPLLTVSNHRSVMDDPLFWAVFSFREFCRNISRFRYILAAHNICFTNPYLTWFFSRGRCVPCVRGEGVFQQGVDHCIEVLNNNGWIHMFPEGKVTPSPIRIKWGIARMISDSRVPPILLPIWINGMETVWPNEGPFWRRLFSRGNAEVFVGNPTDTAQWLIPPPQAVKESELERRKRVADLVQSELFGLGERVEAQQTKAKKDQ